MAVRKIPNGGAGDTGFNRFPAPVILGAYTSQTFTSSGTFTAPMNAPLNVNGKVDCYLTGTAAGGAGGAFVGNNADTVLQAAQGGQAGNWCRRYRIELKPGESVSVTIPGAASAANGGSLTFGTYLTLTGGTKGNNGDFNSTPSALGSSYNGTSGTISSGSNANDNAIRTGARGGKNMVDNNGGSNLEHAKPGGSNLTMGPYDGGQVHSDSPSNGYDGGSGGAGLFGNGGNSSTTGGSAAAANSGGGGGGAGPVSNGAAGGNGAAGQLLIEWRT